MLVSFTSLTALFLPGRGGGCCCVYCWHVRQLFFPNTLPHECNLALDGCGEACEHKRFLQAALACCCTAVHRVLLDRGEVTLAVVFAYWPLHAHAQSRAWAQAHPLTHTHSFTSKRKRTRTHVYSSRLAVHQSAFDDLDDATAEMNDLASAVETVVAEFKVSQV